MIKLGSIDMSKAYVGSTEISKMYLGNGLVYSKGSEVLPYDAEVEYLQTDGNQWIVLPTYISEATDALELVFRKTAITSQMRLWCSTVEEATGLAYANAQDRIGYYNNEGYRAAASSNWAYMGTQKHSVKVDYYGNKVWLDTASWSKAGGNSSAITTGNAKILGSSGASTTFVGLVYGFKFWRSGTLLYELQPVRKNGVGYMYDKVSGTLFSNQGTEDFIIGYDKLSNLEDYTQLNYISNPSTAYLNSMVPASSDTVVKLKFKNNSATISKYPAIMGTRSSSSNRFDLYMNQDSTGFITSRGSWTAHSTGVPVDTNEHVFETQQDVIMLDDTSVTPTENTFTISHPILFFSGPSTSAGSYTQFNAKANIYYIKIYNNEELIRDFVPVRHPSGVYGMFDKVENKFYDSSSNVAFQGN